MTDEKQVSGKGSGLPRLATLRALRIWNLEGSIATVQVTLTTNAFQMGFALYLGCNSFVIGVLAAIPAFAGLLQLVSSYLAERYASRKFIVTVSTLACRLLWLPMLAIPYLLPKDLWVGAFLALTLLSNAFANISTPLWTAWISDLVPEDTRGRYFGARNMYMGITGMIVAIVAGEFLDMATKQSHWSQPAAFGVIFAASTVFALGSFVCGRLSPDVPRSASAAEKRPLREALSVFSRPFSTPSFRGLIAFVAVITAALAVTGNFFTVYSLTYLHLTYSMLQILTAFASLAGLAAMPLWGYLADKYGNRPILILSLCLAVVPAILWCLTWPDPYTGFYTYAPDGHLMISQSKLTIIVLNIFAGAGWSGVGLAQFNLMIGAAPREHRAITVSAVAAVVGVVGGISPLIGGALMEALASASFPTHGLVRTNYHVLFLLSAILRIVALASIRMLPEAESRSARYVLEQLKATKPIGSFAALTRLSRASSSHSRSKAAQELGRLKTPVAVEELVEALDDVSLPVREQAATALGEIGDARAVEPLASKLADPASGIATTAAVALGRIGDKSALPALAAALAQEAPPSQRLAAIEALARLPDARTADLLLPLLDAADPAERLAAIRALAGRESRLRTPKVSEALLALWERETDPAAITALADALGHAGRPEIAPRLLAAYDRAPSPIARREVLNAVGSLLAGRDSFYVYLVLDSFARDETVTKILTSLQRQSTAREPASAPRVAVRIRQAQESYTSGDYAVCVERLGLAAKLLSLPENAARPADESASLEVMGILAARARAGRAVGPEEVLLMVFLLRILMAK